MQLAFSKPTTSEEQGLLFSSYQEAGFAGLQLKHAQYAEFLDNAAGFLDNYQHLPGIASALIAGGRLDTEGQKTLKKLFTFAGAIGSERIVFCHGRSRKGISSDDIKGFARQLSELGLEAQQQGVQLSLHHHHDQPVMYRDDIHTFFDEAQAGAVTLTIDTAHLVKSGIDDVAGVIKDFEHVIDNFHLKDFHQGEWQVLGQGSIDFNPIFAAIRDINYDGWLSADEESGSDVPNALRTCYSFMSTALAHPSPA